MKLNMHLLAHMRQATRALLKKGPVDTAAIVQEAMKQATAFQRPTPAPPPMRDINPPPSGAAANDGAPAQAHPGPQPMADMLADLQRSMETLREQFGGLGGGIGAVDAGWPGTFTSGSYTNEAGTRDYKLYVPSILGSEPAALVVMLHGCTQNPDDFAHGTQMNALAEELGCLVVYPAQSQAANHSRCWNWFSETDQQRE